MEIRKTHSTILQITRPLLQVPFSYHDSQIAVERVIQCDPYPTPYCYLERKEWIEAKYPNNQRIEVWSSDNRGAFQLRYCYCTNAKIVEYASALDNKKIQIGGPLNMEEHNNN